MRTGWEDKLLKDICSVFGRIGFRGYTKADFVSTPDNGAITLSPSNIIGGELSCDKCSYVSWEKYYQSPEIMVFPGDILLVKTASIGKCALVRSLPHEATINPQFVILKEIKVNHQYLTYFLQSPIAQKKFQEFAIGAAVPTFSQKKLEGLIVPTPSLPEQQRIVDILDREFAKIDALKANAEKSLQAAKDLFQATMKKELKPKEGWTQETLFAVSTEMFAGGDAPKNQMADTPSKEYPIPIIANAVENEGLYGYTSIARVSVPSITIAGRGSGTGYVFRRRYSYFPIVRLIVIIPNDNKVCLDYLYFAIKSLNIQSSGSAIPQLTIPMIKNYLIAYPAKSIQEVIIKRLTQIEEGYFQLQENYHKTLTLCDDLKQSLLRKAFNGEL